MRITLSRLYAERIDRALDLKYAQASGDPVRHRTAREALASLDEQINKLALELRAAVQREKIANSTPREEQATMMTTAVAPTRRVCKLAVPKAFAAARANRVREACS